MSDEPFTEPETGPDEWADVRMIDPGKSEWDVDFVVDGGQVEYIDLRVRPANLTEFVTCLLDDVSDERIASVLADIADSKNVDPRDPAGDVSP